MGCDIHIHAEIKLDGMWYHYDQPRCYRWYQLFERMAGVRGEVRNAIAPPRGIPDDSSVITRFEAKRGEGFYHSHSWLSAQEIHELALWWQKNCTAERDSVECIFPLWDQWLCGNRYSDFVRTPDDRRHGIQDVRFVFWFDN